MHMELGFGAAMTLSRIAETPELGWAIYRPFRTVGPDPRGYTPYVRIWPVRGYTGVVHLTATPVEWAQREFTPGRDGATLLICLPRQAIVILPIQMKMQRGSQHAQHVLLSNIALPFKTL